MKTVREYPSLFSTSHKDSSSTDSTSTSWSGLPVIFDEVFTGMYRLGRFNTSTFLNAQPDIIVNAKLLTGGLLPLCTTTASQDIFSAFLSESKSDALLHGHSYTAHPVGCSVAVESLKTMEKLDRDGEWDVFKKSWQGEAPAASASGPGARQPRREAVWSMWDKDFVEKVSQVGSVDYVVALGSVLAIALKDEGASGELFLPIFPFCFSFLRIHLHISISEAES